MQNQRTTPAQAATRPRPVRRMPAHEGQAARAHALALLEAMLLALLAALLPPAAQGPAGPSQARLTPAHLPLVLRLLGALAALRPDSDHDGPAHARPFIPRCQRVQRGARDIVVALAHRPPPRRLSRPAPMPPLRRRQARDPPFPHHVAPDPARPCAP